MYTKKILKWVAILFVAWLVFFVILNLTFRPSHDRDWEPGHEALPFISIEDELVTVTNYRHFKWEGALEAIRDYDIKSFPLTDISGVSVLISHFSDFEGLAHIFLSFELASGTPVVVSLETRREVGEKFSPILGILRQFEIIYVVGDEQDLIGVRTDHRKERVYLYPTKATAEQAQILFLRLAEKINDVYETPQMYNTVLRNCTNEIAREVEKMTELNFPLTWKTVLPGYFDEVLYEMGIINNSLPFADTKQRQLLDNSKVSALSDTYSLDLRRSLEIE